MPYRRLNISDGDEVKNHIWIIDDNSDTQAMILEGLQKRAKTLSSADAWSFECYAKASTALAKLSATDRPVAAVCDLYAIHNIPTRRALASTSPTPDPFEAAVVASLLELSKLVSAGTRVIVYTFVFKYCDDRGWSDMHARLETATKAAGIDFSSIIHKSSLGGTETDLDLIWDKIRNAQPEQTGGSR